MSSADEAVAYARTLHALVRWIDVCDGNMQEGSFRCDANVSVRRRGDERLGTRCEIKNLNSFRFLDQAIRHEATRQIELIESGGRVVQETRLYDPDRGETRPMRSKEDAHDYRYFPDPDLPPLVIDAAWVEQVRAALPELPVARRDRYEREWALSGYDAATLTQSREMADYFEQVVTAVGGAAQAKLVANWVSGELAAALNRDTLEMSDSRVSALALGGLLGRVIDGTISGKIAKEVFDAMWSAGAAESAAADRIIADKGLRQISDSGALEAIIAEILRVNPGQVAEVRAGKEKAFNFLVGQAMKATRGKGNPGAINTLLRKALAD